MTTGARSILVVDDDDAVRTMMCIVLSMDGYSAEGVADGVAALQRLRSGAPPALVIVDLMMPRMDGDTLIRTMSRDTSLAKIPVAIVSGQMNPGTHRLGPQVRARLVKPVELDDLLELVHQVAGEPGGQAGAPPD
jgi:CheY-like chemotaxis protein